MEEGITCFTALLLADNAEMVGLLNRVGEVELKAREGEAIQVEVPLAPEVVKDPALRERAAGGGGHRGPPRLDARRDRPRSRSGRARARSATSSERLVRPSFCWMWARWDSTVRTLR